MSARRKFSRFASVIALTVATFGTSTAFADNEEGQAAGPRASGKTESAPTVSAKTESAKTPAKKAEPAKAEAPKVEPPKAETAKPEASSEPAPLAVRPQKPLTLAPQNESTPWGYKLFAFVVIAAGIAFWVKRRRKIDTTSKKPARLDILARSSVGVRSELMVVEVEGTRLLVGMTPSAISTLAILDSGDPMMAREERATEPAPEPAQLVAAAVTDRVKTLFGKSSAPPARPSIDPPTQRMPAKRTNVTRMRAPVATQAKGLLLALEEDRAIER